MSNVKEAPGVHIESTIPPDILKFGGTLIRFPVIPETSAIALRALAMTRGFATLYYPQSDIGLRKSYQIETRHNFRTIVDLQLNSVTVAKDTFVQGTQYPFKYDEKKVATVKRDGIMIVRIDNTAIPLDILIGKKDTLIAHIKTPWYSHRMIVRDFSEWQTENGPMPHAAVHFVASRNEHKIDPVNRAWSLEFAGKTVCSVHFLT